MPRTPSALQALVTPDHLALCAERFWAKAAQSEGCWEWSAARTAGGYGAYAIPKSASPTGKPIVIGAHRAAWMLANAATIPEGMTIDHLCRNRGCINPAHLEIVTQAENNRRASQPRGFRTFKPEEKVGLKATTWRVRYRRYDDSGKTWASRTFATLAEAQEFTEAFHAQG